MCFFKILILGVGLTLVNISCSSEHPPYLTDIHGHPVLREGESIQDNSAGPILLVTHPSTTFDGNKVAKPGIDKILGRYIESGGSHYVMVTDPKSTSYYPDDYLSANKYVSLSGAHSLSFSRAREFILTGGHLLFCLCETMRDIVLGMPFNAKLKFTFMTDGIYLPGPDSDGKWGKSDETLRPVELLSKFLNTFSDDYLVHFVEKEIIYDGDLCQQNPFPPYSKVSASQLTIQVERNGIPLKVIGHGPQLLIFNFTNSSSILN